MRTLSHELLDRTLTWNAHHLRRALGDSCGTTTSTARTERSGPLLRSAPVPQLGLRRRRGQPGGRARRRGVAVCVLQRILALTAFIWHDDASAADDTLGCVDCWSSCPPVNTLAGIVPCLPNGQFTQVSAGATFGSCRQCGRRR